MSAVARRYFRRAVERLGQGDTEGALDDLHAAVELEPTFDEARVACAALKVHRGDASAAVSLLRSGLEGGRRIPSAEARLVMALTDALIAAGAYAAAEQARERLVELAATARIPAAVLADRQARIMAKTGRFQEAFQALVSASRAPRPQHG